VIALRDPVVALVAEWFRFGGCRPEGHPFLVLGYSVSGGRKR
jgi:hypothetical protein